MVRLPVATAGLVYVEQTDLYIAHLVCGGFCRSVEILNREVVVIFVCFGFFIVCKHAENIDDCIGGRSGV